METFTIAVSLIATTIGTLVLLACMAGKRAELLKILLLQKQLEARQKFIRDSQMERKKKQIIVVSEHGQHDDADALDPANADIQTVS